MYSKDRQSGTKNLKQLAKYFLFKKFWKIIRYIASRSLDAFRVLSAPTPKSRMPLLDSTITLAWLSQSSSR